MMPEQEIIHKEDLFKVFFQVFVNILEKETADPHILIDLIQLYEETTAKYPFRLNSRILNIYKKYKNLPATIQFPAHKGYINSLVEKTISKLLYNGHEIPIWYSAPVTIENEKYHTETPSFCIYDVSFNSINQNYWRAAYYKKKKYNDRLREGDIMRVRYNPKEISGKTFFLECFA